MERKNWRKAKLAACATIQDAIENLNEVAIQIVLVVDESDKLVGTVSDGDIRRALLKGEALSSPIRNVVQANPLVVPENMDRETILKMMRANRIHQVPIVDEIRKIVGLHLWDELTAPVDRENIMVIMAGGFGSRLRPNTDTCPKPMLEVAGKPMLEHIIAQAVQDGFREIYISVHYLGHIIEDYFGDGRAFNVNIRYLKENEPLGTAGGLSILSPCPELPFVVELLSKLVFRQLNQAAA
ncbi:MAG: sugar phosphate nucleotidyltransferase [Gammaproteobacteria bacterium]